jgi:hypothetical protein
MLENARKLAVLWDRVRPNAGGIGRALRLRHGVARARGCRRLKIETQNNNVAACRFYRRMAALGGLRMHAHRVPRRGHDALVPILQGSIKFNADPAFAGAERRG